MAERRGCQIGFRRMKKQKGYDAAKYEPMLNELVRLEKKGFKGIYNGDEQAIADAKKALECKRAILLANPVAGCRQDRGSPFQGRFKGTPDHDSFLGDSGQ